MPRDILDKPSDLDEPAIGMTGTNYTIGSFRSRLCQHLGDEDPVWGELSRELYRPMVRILTSHTKDPGLADELANLALFKFWRFVERRPDDLPLQAHLLSYLVKIGQNCFIDHLRGVRRRPEVDENPPEFDPQWHATDESLIEKMALEDAISRLSDSDRRFLALMGEGHSGADIERILGLSKGSRENCFKNLRRRLRALLQTDESDVGASIS